MIDGVRLTVAVVGATGIVGAEIVRQLAARGFPCRSVRTFGSVRTVGAEIDEGDVQTRVELIDAASASGLDVVFFAAGPALAVAHAKRLASGGAIVIDVSSAHREDASVPLVVPEVNGDVAFGEGGRLLAIPSPTTALLAAVLAPLGRVAAIARVVVSTYQGAGTGGTRALRRLGRGTAKLLGGRGVGERATDEAFECRPSIGSIDAAGLTSHERAVQSELDRVLLRHAPRLDLMAVRVPVFSGIGMSVFIQFAEAIDVSAARTVLQGSPGLLVHEVADPPTLRGVTGSAAVHVGRIHAGSSDPSTMMLWVAADGVAKGKAAAAVATAELAIRGRLM